MFRRRRFSPPIEQARARLDEELARAQMLFQAGRYSEAGTVFEQIATIAEARGGPRAPRFYLQAGRSWIHAQVVARGMLLLEKGWTLALRTDRQDLLGRMGPALVEELRAMGLIQESSQISTWLSKISPVMERSQPQNSTGRPQLPLKCPSCGAPVNPTLAKWADDTTAECDFCGSFLRGT